MRVVEDEQYAKIIAAEYFPNKYQGIYVDVGAGYPIFHSNSHMFREKGWQIIAIEPQPNMCEEFRRLGYPVLEYACSATDIGETDFEVCEYCAGLGASSFKVLDKLTRETMRITSIRVQAYTLNTILQKHHPDITHIDILDVDVEYYELDVLKGLDINKYSPDVMIIENLPTDTGLYANPNRDLLYEYYDFIGYEIVAVAGGINEILRKKKT